MSSNPIEFDIDGVTHRITADKYQWILSRKVVIQKTGEVTWRPERFYSNARAFAERLALLGAGGQLDDVLAGVQRIAAALEQLLPARAAE